MLTTDQGTEFKNSLNKEMMQLLGIKYHLTTAYHPQVVIINIRLYLAASYNRHMQIAKTMAILLRFPLG